MLSGPSQTLFIKFLKDVQLRLTAPAISLSVVLLIYGVIYYVLRLMHVEDNNFMVRLLYVLVQLTIVSIIYWTFWRVIEEVWQNLQKKFSGPQYVLSMAIGRFFKNALKAIVGLSFLAVVIDFSPLPAAYAYVGDHLISMGLIIVITLVMTNMVHLAAQFIMVKYHIGDQHNILARKSYTQLIIVKRILIVLISVVGVGAILLLFDSVRELGASLLASAGIAGVVIGFAAQKYLNNLLIGIQIAVYQPIRINDWITIEEEFGQVEEINSYYAVIKLWDLRRLIVPIQYFLEKMFLNLSRTSTDLLGTIFLYVDYTLPIQPLRDALENLLTHSTLWDKKFYNLQVSEAKEFTLQLRILVSATRPDNAWDLCCEVREKLIYFIQKNYPESLSQVRTKINCVRGVDQGNPDVIT